MVAVGEVELDERLEFLVRYFLNADQPVVRVGWARTLGVRFAAFGAAHVGGVKLVNQDPQE